MDEVEIDVFQSPRLVLRLRLSEGVVFLVVVVPELGNDEDLFAFHNAFFDGSLYASAGFALVLVVICAVKEAVADLDGLCCGQICTLQGICRLTQRTL